MVLLFSGKKSQIAEEISEILTNCGGMQITPKGIRGNRELFYAVSINKPCEIELGFGVAVFCDECKGFSNQILPSGIIGICEENNSNALKLLKKCRNPTVTCGMNNKNTVTVSSHQKDEIIAAIQRNITDLKGNLIEPCEFKMSLKKEYSPFSVLAAITVLLLSGITAP